MPVNSVNKSKPALFVLCGCVVFLFCVQGLFIMRFPLGEKQVPAHFCCTSSHNVKWRRQLAAVVAALKTSNCQTLRSDFKLTICPPPLPLASTKPNPEPTPCVYSHPQANVAHFWKNCLVHPPKPHLLLILLLSYGIKFYLLLSN